MGNAIEQSPVLYGDDETDRAVNGRPASIDQYRINWAESIRLRKQGIDSHLAQLRQGAKPAVHIDALNLALLLAAILFVCAFLLGYRDGLNGAVAARQSSVEPSSRVTQCTSYDVRNGQKYCLAWKRVKAL